MKKLKRMILFIMAPLTVAAAVMVGCNVGQYEEPHYAVLDQAGTIELRQYDPAIAAEVTVTGERKEAISQGFRLIADYIFGNNQTRDKVAMTAPVIQQSSQNIAMTAPVIQQEGNAGKWNVQFIMPHQYTLETLPVPNNEQVKLKLMPERKLAVIRFAGSNKDEDLLKDKTVELQAYIVTRKLNAHGAPILAFYDPPWTLPFLRHNEVMLEVSDAKPAKASKRH